MQMVLSPNTVPVWLDQKLNSTKSHICLRKIMYYLKHKIGLNPSASQVQISRNLSNNSEAEWGKNSQPSFIKAQNCVCVCVCACARAHAHCSLIIYLTMLSVLQTR